MQGKRPLAAYWTYVLAFIGAHLAFIPLFVLLLPRRVATLEPENTAIWLSILLFTGGVVAGLANVLAGAFGDRWLIAFGSRRGLIALGAWLLMAAYLLLALTMDITCLLFALVFFQIALNCCFSPLGALLADHFPDAVKGRLGGWMSAALPTSTLLVLPIAWLFPSDNQLAFLLTGGLAVLCMLPLLITWRLGSVIEASPTQAEIVLEARSIAQTTQQLSFQKDFSLAWLSRLLVQIGAAFVFGYIYLYIQWVQLARNDWQDIRASEILAALTAPAAILAILATLVAGHLSDRSNNRRVPLFFSSCVFGAGMAMLALTADIVWLFIGYTLLQTSLAAYLAVDTALIAQLVSNRPDRGLLLGIMNLSNTLPSVIVPAMALLAFADSQVASILASMFAGFAILAVVAGGLVLLIRGVR